MTEPKKTSARKIKEDCTQEAYMGIRRMFFHNEIIPGQKISYGDLADRLNMSTTPVIQALKRLEFQGLVRHEPNRGYYTEDISLTEITEIYDFRELIEVSLLPDTLNTIGRPGEKKLKKALDAHLAATRDIYLRDRLLRDMEFHLVLAELSGNRIRINSLKFLFDLLYLKYRGNILFVTPMDRVDADHIELYESVIQRDLACARQVLSRHIVTVKDHALECIRRSLEAKRVRSL